MEKLFSSSLFPVTLFRTAVICIVLLLLGCFLVQPPGTPLDKRSTGGLSQENPEERYGEFNVGNNAAKALLDHTFYTHITFGAIEGRKDDIWAVGNDMLFHIRGDTDNIRVIDIGLEKDENIVHIAHSAVALYLKSQLSLYRYDLFSQNTERITMPAGISMETLRNVLPLVWDAGG